MNIKKDIRFRVYVAFTCMLLFGMAILVKAALVQIKEGETLKNMAQEMLTRTKELPAERGNIYNEDGLLLCSTIPQFDIRVDFTVIDKDSFYTYVDDLAAALSALFNDASAAAYRARLVKGYKSKKQYYLLKRNIAYYDYQSVRTFPIFDKGQRRGGLIVESKTKRVNPYGLLAYRTIGLYRENAQTIGLESSFDSVLSGENGMRMERKMTGGVWVPLEGSETEAVNGRDIVTTIDISIQEVAEHALMSVLKQYECEYGTVVVMEVPTGKIRAMVNLGRQKDGSYWEDFNYAMIPTEPGSTFKLATIASLIRDGYINVEDNVDCEHGAKRFGNRIMHDSHHGLGIMSIKEAFAHSSNVAMASLAHQYYNDNPKKFVQNIKALHLNSKTHIELEGERKALMVEPHEKLWSATSLPWMATGYGIMVSPLQTCMLYNAVANDGKMMKPYLVSAVKEYGKTIRTIKPTVLIENIVPPEDIGQLQACVREVAISGTARHIASPLYNISGKTGTAQVADKGIKYSDGVYQGSFVGYFPSEKPRYTVAVVIRTKPHSSAYYGGTLAAPVFRMVADKIFANGMGIWNGPLDSLSKNKAVNYVSNHSASSSAFATLFKTLGSNIPLPTTTYAKLSVDSNHQLKILPQSINYGVVPNVNGMALKDAVYLLENEGLKVIITGRGTIHNQSIAPGTKVQKGKQILLQLS